MLHWNETGSRALPAHEGSEEILLPNLGSCGHRYGYLELHAMELTHLANVGKVVWSESRSRRTFSGGLRRLPTRILPPLHGGLPIAAPPGA